MIRNITYKVTGSGISPVTKQFGGMQGEHRATRITFEIESELFDTLTDPTFLNNNNLVYRIDGYNGEGGVLRSDTVDFSGDSIEYLLEERLTRYGGTVKVVLVISLIDGDKTEMELYSFPAVLQLKSLPDGEETDDENRESMSTLAEVAKEAAEAAKAVKTAYDNGELKGEKGDQGTSVTVQNYRSSSIDDGYNVLTFSDGVEIHIKNGSKGSPGEKGDKGDKGEDGKDAITDQTYNPESENAQSGKAVTEAINNLAPVIKNTKSGTTITANDVSPIEHELDVKVKRNPKNLIPYPFSSIASGTSKTVNGITFSDNGDGTITANGTATAQAQIQIYSEPTIYNGAYTTSGCPEGAIREDGETGFMLLVGWQKEGSSTIGYNGLMKVSGFQRSFDNEKLLLFIRVTAGTTVNNVIFKPQFELGGLTEFEPYIRPSDVNISVCEKNLLSINNVTVPYQEEQVIFQGNEDGDFLLSFENNLVGGNEAAPLFEILGDGATLYVDSATPLPYAYSGNLKKVTLYNWRAATSGSLDNIILAKNPQTKLANGDGIVEGLKSVSPDMVVFADKNGAYIDCTYKADTKKYIDNKFAELSTALLNS